MRNEAFAGDQGAVSFDSEELILVDEKDAEVGHLTKAECHEGSGVLHRAFSLFVFNEAGELLLQQRSPTKRLWPLYWSNSCCSHPRRGERMEDAIHRRLGQELGMQADLVFLYKFRYQARFGDIGSEREFCWVYAGASSDPPCPNSNEIAAWRFLSLHRVSRELERKPDQFTPWMKLEWGRISSKCSPALNAGRGSFSIEMLEASKGM